MLSSFLSFLFNDTATTEIYTLSLHDALPIWRRRRLWRWRRLRGRRRFGDSDLGSPDLGDRKSTRLNSSHANISYAVFCLKKKKKHRESYTEQPPQTPRHGSIVGLHVQAVMQG